MNQCLFDIMYAEKQYYTQQKSLCNIIWLLQLQTI